MFWIDPCFHAGRTRSGSPARRMGKKGLCAKCNTFLGYEVGNFICFQDLNLFPRLPMWTRTRVCGSHSCTVRALRLAVTAVSNVLLTASLRTDVQCPSPTLREHRSLSDACTSDWDYIYETPGKVMSRVKAIFACAGQPQTSFPACANYQL